jgi:hypothetical protein
LGNSACVRYQAHRLLFARGRQPELFEFGQEWVLSWVPRTNLFVRVIRPPVIESSSGRDNFADKTGLSASEFPDRLIL